MKSTESTIKYVAFLRGINVGGHHKVPMAELRKELEGLNLKNVATILNSGNVLFDSTTENLNELEQVISERLEKTFGFSIPTILVKILSIKDLLDNDPFKEIEVTKETRLYVSFLKNDVKTNLELPWTSEDGSFTILDKRHKTIISVLDLSISNTPKGMEALEKHFGKDITTRNWNTIKRIEKKL